MKSVKISVKLSVKYYIFHIKTFDNTFLLYLSGKYAIRQLVSRLPRDFRNNLPDDTICAVVATLYEVVKDNQDFAL